LEVPVRPTDHQTNEGRSYVSALCDGDFWRVSGDYGVLKAAEIKQNETFIVRRKELEKMAVKQRN